jgi:VanZ family protein
VRWLARWWPAIVWAGVIFALSTGEFSAEHTGHIILPILRFLFPHASAVALAEMHNVIRKCAHVAEYFVLGWLVLRGLRGRSREMNLRWALTAVIIVALYAVLDEWHQAFVPGRGGLELDDILLDTASGMAAQAIAALVVLRERAWQKRKAELQPRT